MYFWLSIGQVLADRIPDRYFNIIMLLGQAGRLLFKPSLLMDAELQSVEDLLKQFCQGSYSHVYAGKEQRLRVCRPTVVAVLDIPRNLRCCGRAWSWQLPAERIIGTLSRLIRSRRFPYAALTTAVSAKYSAELVTSFSESYAAEAWADATGKPARRENQDPARTFRVSKEPTVDLLPPHRPAEALIGQELANIKDVLLLEGAPSIPDHIFAKKNIRMRLANVQIAGAVCLSDEAADRRRD